MPDSSLTLEMLIREGKAIIGLNRVAEAEAKVEKSAAGISREMKRAEAELDRFAKRTTQLNATPIEKYRAQVERLDNALAKNKISHETYTRAVARARAELENVGRVQQSALGGRFLGQITNFAAGYLTLGRAVQLVGDAFQHAKAESEGALGTMRGLDDGRRKLAQLAVDMPAGSLAAMQERADRAAMASGASRSTAYEVLFQAHSYGFEKEYEKVMGMNPIIEAGAASSIAGKVRLMTGSKKSIGELVAGLIEAGKPSEVDAETLAGPMAIALEGGRRLGAGAEETMALLSSMTMFYAGRGEVQGEGKTGAARVAGDRLRAFAHKVATRLPEHKDKGFIGAFEAVRSLSDDERAEFLKENEEVSSAYESYLEARDRTQQIYQRVQRAEELEAAGQGNVSVGLAIRAADPKSRASIMKGRADIQKEIAQEDALGVAYAKSTSRAAGAEASAYRSKQNFFSQFLISSFARGTAALRGSPGAVEANALIGGSVASHLTGDAATGGFGLAQFIAQRITDMVVESRLQTELLQTIASGSGGGGGASRVIAQEAAAPLN